MSAKVKCGIEKFFLTLETQALTWHLSYSPGYFDSSTFSLSLSFTSSNKQPFASSLTINQIYAFCRLF